MNNFFSTNHYPGLFRSQSWLSAWRESWGGHPDLKYPSSSGQQSLSSTLVSYSDRIKKVLPVETAFPLGVSTSTARSIRSEYFNSGAAEPDLCLGLSFIQTLKTHRLDQLYIPDVLEESAEWYMWESLSKEHRLGFVVKEKHPTYGVDLHNNDFASYLSQLGSNTRLKLYNRRKNLRAIGEITRVNLWPNQDYFYELLNAFHEKRWGKPCYQDKNLAFMRLLLNNLASEGHQIDLSLMMVNQQPVSVMLDIEFNGRIYNLQSGYLENFAKNISLGTLHFGYQIESGFDNPKADFYDFMAGKGKNADYKSALANRTAMFNSLLLVRNPFLKILYSAQKHLARN